jgi:hypothetical protein
MSSNGVDGFRRSEFTQEITNFASDFLFETKLQCISFDTSTKLESSGHHANARERCPRTFTSMKEKGFCEVHLQSAKPKIKAYKKVEEGLVDLENPEAAYMSLGGLSIENLLKMYARTRDAISLRLKFREMFVHPSQLDYGHEKRIDLLQELSDRLEETLTAKFIAQKKASQSTKARSEATDSSDMDFEDGIYSQDFSSQEKLFQETRSSSQRTKKRVATMLHEIDTSMDEYSRQLSFKQYEAWNQLSKTFTLHMTFQDAEGNDKLYMPKKWAGHLVQELVPSVFMFALNSVFAPLSSSHFSGRSKGQDVKFDPCISREGSKSWLKQNKPQGPLVDYTSPDGQPRAYRKHTSRELLKSYTNYVDTLLYILANTDDRDKEVLAIFIAKFCTHTMQIMIPKTKDVNVDAYLGSYIVLFDLISHKVMMFELDAQRLKSLKDKTRPSSLKGPVITMAERPSFFYSSTYQALRNTTLESLIDLSKSIFGIIPIAKVLLLASEADSPQKRDFMEMLDKDTNTMMAFMPRWLFVPLVTELGVNLMVEKIRILCEISKHKSLGTDVFEDVLDKFRVLYANLKYLNFEEEGDGYSFKASKGCRCHPRGVDHGKDHL